MKVPMSVFSIRTISIAVALVSVGFFAARLTRYASRPTFGFETYYSSAILLSSGIPAEILYDDSEFNRQRAQKAGIHSREPFAPNPPPTAILFIPLTLVSLPMAKILWECLSLGFLLVFFLIIKKEKNLDLVESFALIAFAFAFTPLSMNFVYGQMYALLLLLLSSMYWAWRSKRQYLTALFLASLLLLKGFGVFLILLLLLRKEWMVLGLTLGMLLVGVVVSAVLVGIGGWGAYMTSIFEVLTQVGSSPLQQNVVGFVGTITDIAAGTSGVTGVISAGLIAGSAGILFWFSRRPDSGDIRTPFGIAVILSLLFSPVIADYHYALLLLPLFFLYDRLSHGFSNAQLAMLAVAMFLLSAKLPLTSGVRGTVEDLLAFPRVYGSLLLLVLFFTPVGWGSNLRSDSFSTAIDGKQ